MATSHHTKKHLNTQVNVWAVVPVKLWLHSKMRLSNVLTQQQRIDLSRAMLCDLLDALSTSKKIKRILLVGHAEQLQELVEKFNICVLDEQLLSSSELFTDNKNINKGNRAEQYLRQNNNALNLAALQGFLFAKQQGAEQVCMIHADLPWLNAQQVDSLLAQTKNTQQVTLVTDKKSQGTNLIILNSQQQPEFLFGLMSRQKHQQLFRQLQCSVSILNLKNISQDIDTAEDFFNLQSQIRYAINNGLDYPQRCAQFFKHYAPTVKFKLKDFFVAANTQSIFNKSSLKKHSFNSAAVSISNKQPQL